MTHEQAEQLQAADREPKRLITLPGRAHYAAYHRRQQRIQGEAYCWR